ncbi:MAG: hypothetical protein KIT56_08415 [Gammaproteobacteria bacterium]|nr:hypothetical protein [Gammaproteobacteria bacterium]MCW5583883.1 hypothetical protein [Gammaproteobacteria bacterium]
MMFRKNTKQEPESQSSTNIKPALNYLWVGQPTKDNPNAIAGHDILGPIEAAMQMKHQNQKGWPTNEIVFWCLKEYKDYYKQLFQNEDVDIMVKSIDTLIEEEIQGSELKEQAEVVRDALIKLKKNSTHDLVQFKDLFSLFLLNSQPGYILDTNVRLYPTLNKMLEVSDNISINFDYLTEVSAVRSPDSEYQGDFYLLYSPQRKCEKALKIFDDWNRNPGFGKISVLRDINILSSLQANIFFKEPPYGLFKISFKSSHDIPYKGLFYFMEIRCESFKKIIRLGNINHQQICKFSEISNDRMRISNIDNGTLLHHLVLKNDTEKVKILLDNGANFNLKAKYEIKIIDQNETKVEEFTPLELASYLIQNNLINDQGMIELIKNKQGTSPVKEAHTSVSDIQTSRKNS